MSVSDLRPRCRRCWPSCARELPTSGGKLGDLLYEPKWDGFRAIVFRDGDDIEIGSRNEKPLTRYFPDLVDAAARATCPSAASSTARS